MKKAHKKTLNYQKKISSKIWDSSLFVLKWTTYYLEEKNHFFRATFAQVSTIIGFTTPHAVETFLEHSQAPKMRLYETKTNGLKY